MPPDTSDSSDGPSPEVSALLAANQAFYDAHEARDLDAMARVWDNAGDMGDVVDRGIVCVHPGWPILRGRDAVP